MTRRSELGPRAARTRLSALRTAGIEDMQTLHSPRCAGRCASSRGAEILERQTEHVYRAWPESGEKIFHCRLRSKTSHGVVSGARVTARDYDSMSLVVRCRDRASPYGECHVCASTIIIHRRRRMASTHRTSAGYHVRAPSNHARRHLRRSGISASYIWHTDSRSCPRSTFASSRRRANARNCLLLVARAATCARELADVLARGYGPVVVCLIDDSRMILPRQSTETLAKVARTGRPRFRGTLVLHFRPDERFAPVRPK